MKNINLQLYTDNTLRAEINTEQKIAELKIVSFSLLRDFQFRN